ncbi:MAG: putative ATP-dependent DNA ligase YkoU [Candidatus Dependentiae bacterium ADurb.Bin331]|nr:MAG: putative ATP-dependent DNA ligase YkoU [Candidatus Dependentiae bacterium ADurb.Bin331]
MFIESNQHKIEITHPEKILFAPSKITKGDLVHYYYDVAQYILPYMKNRPLTMVRYPYGIKEEGFYHKDAPAYFPSWIKRAKVKKEEGGFTNYVVCNNAATLVYLANQNCITPHLWLSKTSNLAYPDRMIFDIDPSDVKRFDLVKQTALAVKAVLDELDLKSFVMTTGSHGVHVVVPLNAKEDYDAVRDFAYHVAELVVSQNPKTTTLELRKNKRGKKVFIDYLRNGFGATAVTPFGVRPKPGAPIATPLAWKEVESDTLDSSQKYNINNIFARLKKVGDPWKDFFKTKQSLKKARKKLDQLMSDS